MTDPGADAAIAALKARVERQVLGKPEVVELALVCVLSGGHLLLEDVPGVGKTTLGLAVARALGGRFRRVQFTSDLLPSDILGTTVLDPRTGAFEFRQGPIFANVVLADELNRTTPRTQSALLEAMNEGQVSVDGESYPLPSPFLVVATQNSRELHGTFPLPEAQLDRFLICTSMGYPGREAEREILRGASRRGAQEGEVIDADGVRGLMRASQDVRVHPEIEDYVLDLAAASRASPRLVRGVSTRGAESLVRAARSLARLRGRDFVIPEDVRGLAVPVLAHRVTAREAEGVAAGAVEVRALLAALPSPI